MLKIIDYLKPFIEDNYRRVNVREYSRIQKISPPTASKLLDSLHNENLLKKETDRQYIYYYANKDSWVFIDLARFYWRYMLEKSGLVNHFENELLSPVIMLFGSLSKAEAKQDSDVDIAVFTPTTATIDASKYEKALKRKVHIMQFHKINDVKNKELLNNILNGYRISGGW